MSEKPIQRRRFFGWQRIGIVLSVLWIIGTFAYALNQQSEDAAFFHSICIKGGKTFNECWEESRVFREISWEWEVNVLGLALLQIGIAWLCVYLVVVTVRWIVKSPPQGPGPTSPP